MDSTRERPARMWYNTVQPERQVPQSCVSGDQSAVVNVDRRPQISQIAGSLRPATAAQAINRIARAERHLDLNANTQLCIETLLADLARIERDEPAGATA